MPGRSPLLFAERSQCFSPASPAWPQCMHAVLLACLLYCDSPVLLFNSLQFHATCSSLHARSVPLRPLPPLPLQACLERHKRLARHNNPLLPALCACISRATRQSDPCEQPHSRPAAMAPRSRARASQAAKTTVRAPAGIGTLPDDVLLRCLESLDLEFRREGLWQGGALFFAAWAVRARLARLPLGPAPLGRRRRSPPTCLPPVSSCTSSGCSLWHWCPSALQRCAAAPRCCATCV